MSCLTASLAVLTLCADPVCCLACHSCFCALQAAQQLQKSGVSQFVLDDMDFGRRYALEKEIRAGGARLVV